MKFIKVSMPIMIILILFLIGIVVISPFITIWSLNTLFALDIDYTIWTWLAMVWLSMVTFGGIISVIRKRDDK